MYINGDYYWVLSHNNEACCGQKEECYIWCDYNRKKSVLKGGIKVRPTSLPHTKEGRWPEICFGLRYPKTPGNINEANYVINQKDYLRVTGGGLLEKVLCLGVEVYYGFTSSPIIYSRPSVGVFSFFVVSLVPLWSLFEVNVDSEVKNRLKTRNITGMIELILC